MSLTILGDFYYFSTNSSPVCICVVALVPQSCVSLENGMNLLIIHQNNTHTLFLYCDSPGYHLGCLSLWPFFFFFLFHLFLLPLTGDRRGPLLQCHLSDQNRGRPAAVFSEPHYRRAGCAADAGFWGPGSFGHWDLLQFPGGGCGPRRAHASGAGDCHGPHHGRGPWISHQHSLFPLVIRHL